MKKLPLLIIVSATVLWSCEKKNVEENVAETQQEETLQADSSGFAKIPVTEKKRVVESEVLNPNSQGANKPTVENSKNTTGRPKLNPAHGEPFHRCEIPVGAPIDSQPASTPAPQVNMQQNMSGNNFNTNPIPATAPRSAPNSGSKPAVNPPHGEPHHRCDIEVGAPLI